MTEVSFADRLKQTEPPVLVEIWAPWCLPCRRMAPDLERLEQEYAGQVEVWKVNADEESDLVQELNVFGIPTLILYHQGEELLRRTGAQSRPALETLFSAAHAGGANAELGLSNSDRVIRLMAGVGLLMVALLSGPSWILTLAGSLILFSAVYDRCPIWRLVSTRLKLGRSK